ncbi:U-box domain-containing protein 16 isoform X2 [Neltuma alba]|uniref:U-box domain-containing protein 16 isoform X2 n=1 Tax=Neltuma alba TaxID=207710 RepID=UPI0010A57D8F|nr:U-box domain-containing protein 16 isoform X2 [Prosopis alba]
MAIPPQIFPPRKRRPSAASFISPKLTELDLLHSLLHLSREISSLKPIQFLLKRNSSSIIRKTNLLAVLFEELIRSSVSLSFQSAILCFEEMYIVLQRIRTLIEDCSNGSKMALLMQNESIADNLHKLTADLSTLLDIFPVTELDLSEDVRELVILIRKQCTESKAFVDPKDNELRREVVTMLDRIKREIVPDHSKLADIFGRLEIRDSSSCRAEIESLEEEIQNRTDEQCKSELVALIGLVRYAKCVLFEASTPSSSSSDDVPRRKQPSEIVVPADFRCPITLELMRDPVVVATGQTYDRESIKLWLESGHNTCPKTGQTMAHTDLIPNRALKNLIAMWCREQKIFFETAGGNDRPHGVIINKAALEATRMTASFLVNKLSLSPSMEAANAVVYELRVLAKTDSDSRACIAEAGAIPLLVSYLSFSNPNLQVNAVTTILNLSILEANKTRILETDGALTGVVEVLRSGTTWEAKANAAATIFSLSGVPPYRKRLGRKTRVTRGLIDLARCGPTSAKRDALLAILTLATDRETVARLVEAGVVEMTAEVMDGLPEEAVTILEVVVKRGGLVAVAAAFGSIKKLGAILREGSDRARESAAATLATMCRKGGSDIVEELASLPGIERVIWELMAIGTVRGKRKAATLLRALRRWAAGLDGAGLTEGFSTAIPSSATMVSTQ